jgi:hypothetical protein
VGDLNPFNNSFGMSGWDPNNEMSDWYDTVEDVLYSGGYWKAY